jgi:hypothetical protein
MTVRYHDYSNSPPGIILSQMNPDHKIYLNINTSSKTTLKIRYHQHQHLYIYKYITDIRMDLREIGWGGMHWIDVAQDRDQWRDLVNTVMNLAVP